MNLGKRLDKMKKFAHLLSIGLVFVLLGCGTETPAPASSTKVTGQAPISSKNLPSMSWDEFEEIKNGMAYEQVTAIVGASGEIVVETGNPGNQFYTVTYQFKGEGSMWANANAQLTFQGGQLTTKAQMGIQRNVYEEIGKFK